MLGGYMGRILWVNMTDRTVREEALDEKLARDFVGGYGLAARIAYDRMPANADPLGPDNILGFVTGPLTGTPCIEGNRYYVTCKSPLTDTWGNANGGGRFGPHLKFSGYDAVFVTGKSTEPLYLHINSGKGVLKSAAHLWGKDSNETEEALQAELGKDTQVACIGQAGEKISLIAAVMNDGGRAAARSGVGAVMGSKGLKAIAVQGKLEVPMADPEAARALRKTYMDRKTPYHDFLGGPGTIAATPGSSTSGDSFVRNYAGVGVVDFPQGPDVFNPEKTLAYQTRKYGCWQCTLACGGHMEVKDGPYKVKGHKPEYENATALGTLCLNDNFESVVKLNDMVNRYGLDAISAGAAIAFAMELYEKGIITKADTGGLELTWGNSAAMVTLLDMIGQRKGIGDVLADGVKKAAARIGKGADQYAVHVQGQEPGQHDPKLDPAYAISFLDAAPGSHMHTLYAPGLYAMGIEPGPAREQVAGRGVLHKQLTTLINVVNSAGVCAFGYVSYDAAFITDFLTAVTGEKWDLDRWLLAGERIANIRHAFNLREGQNPVEWKWHPRLVGNPQQTAGPNAGVTVDTATLMKDYFAEMDWDVKTARPSAARLRALGLGDLVEAVGR